MVDYKAFENLKNVDFWRAVCCELVATSMLIFIGCGSIILHLPDSIVASSDIVRIALAFGLSVTVLIRTFGPISGCHVNPAVTLGLLSVGRISLVRAVIYVAAQTVGAIAGTALLFGIVPGDKRNNLGLTALGKGVNEWQGVVAELFLTFVLLLVICACTDEQRRDYQMNKSTNPLVIGFTVAVLHLMAIPYTGSSINPVRSFGPSLFNWYWQNQWIYWVGPMAGGCLGAIAYRALLHRELSLPTVSDSSCNSNNHPVATIADVRRQYQRYGMVSVEMPMATFQPSRSSSSASSTTTNSNSNVDILEMIKE